MAFKPLGRTGMAARVAQDIPEGWYVNLGIGIPTLIADHIPADREVVLHSENGILGIGPAPASAQGKSLAGQCQHAARQPAARRQLSSTMPTASPSSAAGISISACSAASRWRRMATWRIGRIRRHETGRQIGGAMDLAVGAKRVWVVMEHTTKDGQARILRQCSYPLTAAACVSRVYTNLAVLDVTPRGFVVTDMVAGLSFEELQARTEAPLLRG